MSSQQHPLGNLTAQPPSPSETSPTLGGIVRRHHTISSSSRSARAASRDQFSEDDQALDLDYWKDDEPVDQDWVGGVGAVGEKGLLQRQSSLPTKYHRAFQGQSSKHTGALTPKTLNSLSAIAGHEGDEEDWEKEMRGLRTENEHTMSNIEHLQHQPLVDSHPQSSNPSPLNTHFTSSNGSSPPPASFVRRTTSLTHGPSGRTQTGTNLRRGNTVQGTKHSKGQHSPSPPNTDQDYVEDAEEYAYDDEPALSPPPQLPQQYSGSPMGRGSPWGTPNDWRGTGGLGYSNANNNSASSAMDDVTIALSNLEMDQSLQSYQGGQLPQAPRFSTQSSGNRTPNGGNTMPTMTDMSGRKSHGGNGAPGYVSGMHPYRQPSDDRGPPPAGSSGWDGKEKPIARHGSGTNLHYSFEHGRPGSGGIPNVPTIPAQYLNQPQQNPAPRLAGTGTYPQLQPGAQGGIVQNPGFSNAAVDVATLIATKGYNPMNFDTRPAFARFFVIKSYTEDDVHKSLKYEIWSSTDPGNKRLDKAFKESAGRGPIYLFFSVNASGHFCGVAEMLTPVDYTRSSKVWASDKWKGVFKVRWIFVRDIPNASLRHIRLNNTQERKPVTNSRDTQELLPEAGQEMLQIFHTHPARTSLLQDFAFYEMQQMQKMQQGPTVSPQPLPSPQLSPGLPQQPPYGANAPYGVNPMMPVQMNIGMNNQFAVPSTQAMHQSVLRHHSPGPGSGTNQPYIGVSPGQAF